MIITADYGGDTWKDSPSNHSEDGLGGKTTGEMGSPANRGVSGGGTGAKGQTGKKNPTTPDESEESDAGAVAQGENPPPDNGSNGDDGTVTETQPEAEPTDTADASTTDTPEAQSTDTPDAQPTYTPPPWEGGANPTAVLGADTDFHSSDGIDIYTNGPNEAVISTDSGAVMVWVTDTSGNATDSGD
jgi:hypothetical protein